MGNGKKIWDADGYEKTSGFQFRDARETIEEIVKENLDGAEIIVDIGCGSGNVTQDLSNQIPHKKIYAIDCDPQMISYANENHNDGTINYVIQDMNLPWNHLDHRLKDLEGKVDLIFSNFCFHWIKEKATVAKSIGRLLKSGGRCYVNTSLMRDFNEFATEEERQENLKYITCHSQQEQLSELTDIFNNCGLKKVNVELIFKDWLYDSEDEYIKMLGRGFDVYLARLWRENVSEEKRNELRAKYKLLYTQIYGVKTGQNVKETKMFDLKQVYYDLLRIIGTK